jgi:hypothetical protein
MRLFHRKEVYVATVDDIFALEFVLLVLILIIVVFVRISMRLRRGGGSLTTTVLGATDEFLTHEKSKAAETIVDENAGKKFEQLPTTTPKSVRPGIKD